MLHAHLQAQRVVSRFKVQAHVVVAILLVVQLAMFMTMYELIVFQKRDVEDLTTTGGFIILSNISACSRSGAQRMILWLLVWCGVDTTCLLGA